MASGAVRLLAMDRRFFLTGLVATPVGGALAQAAPPPPLVFHAGQPGRLTSDRDRQGGNPFASALVEVLKVSPLTLEAFSGRMAAANLRYSGGWQQLDPPRRLPDPFRRLDGSGARVALVLINADYSRSGTYSLPGAAFDAQRVPAALIAAGYETTLVLDADSPGARRALDAFAVQSEAAETALVYVGGHGLQKGREVHWLLGDYPAAEAKWLPTHAIPLNEIGRAAQARSLNLVLYASCRDDPFR